MFGPSLVLLRLPIVLFNVLFAIIVALLTKKILGKVSSLFAILLIMILPYFVMQTRFALDCNLLVYFIAFITYSLVIAIEKRNNIHYLIAGVIIGLSLYTYILSWLIIPLMLVLLIFFLIYYKKITFINIVYLFLPIIGLAIPLILMLVINIFDMNQITLFDMFTVPKLFKWRGSEVALNNVFVNLKYYWSSLTFDNYNYNSNSMFGTVYYALIPLVFIGFILSIHKFIKSLEKKK